LRTTIFKLTGFAAVLAAVFAGAALAGAALDPLEEEPTSSDGHTTGEPAAPADHSGDGEPGHREGEPQVAARAGSAEHPGEAAGLAIADERLRLVLEDSELRPGRAEPFRFRIVERDGSTLRELDTEHRREMHLIVVGRDLSGYQHLHPRLGSDGTWEVELTLPEAGAYRALADFAIGGEKHTLAADILAAGEYRPRALPEPSGSDSAGAYEVTLGDAQLAAGVESELAFTVSRDGRPVAGLEDYLGARGHLVALREGDLGFLHVHPLETGSERGAISFAARFPTAGRYRLFLQFKDRGRVRTVAFTVEVDR
jgi:hypothetical protein